jgi:methyltransferase OMS1
MRRWVLGGALVYAGGVAATLLYLRASRVPAALSAPVSEPQRLAAFEANAPHYDADISWHEWLAGISRLRARLCARARGRVLELGVGTGRNFVHYPAGARVVAVDFAPQMLAAAAATGAALGYDVQQAARGGGADEQRAATEDFLSSGGGGGGGRRAALLLEASVSAALPFADGSFDTVVDTFGLCSYEDPAQALREMRRVLAPGGALLLLEHGASSHGWLSRAIDGSAAAHAAKHGCWWNRRIAELVGADGARLRVEEMQRRHFGTTYFIVARAREDAGEDCAAGAPQMR